MTPDNKPLVSIIAPVFNEEAAIVEFVERVQSVCGEIKERYRFELILVDDGSADDSLPRLKELARVDSCLRLIELRRNFGQTPALQAGIDYARGEILITLDSDLQHFPEEIPTFLDKLDEGYDIVCGWRKNRAEGLLRRVPSAAANWIIRRITRLPFHDFGTTFRAYRAEIAKELHLFGDFHRFVPALGHEVGARIAEIPIKNVPRTKGVSSYGLERTFGVLLDLFLLSFFVRYIDRPMRAFGKLGALCFALGFMIIAYMTWVAYAYDFPMFREHPGWFMLAVMLMISSVQTLIAGVLAELLIRILYGHGEQRVYRVRNEWNSSNLG